MMSFGMVRKISMLLQGIIIVHITLWQFINWQRKLEVGIGKSMGGFK
jgi:hypothetical protein